MNREPVYPDVDGYLPPCEPGEHDVEFFPVCVKCAATYASVKDPFKDPGTWNITFPEKRGTTQ